MSGKNFIQVFEYQKLRVGENGFKKSHFDAMVKFNERNDNKYFRPIFNGIQFNSHVGVIQIGGLTLEILPKADRDNYASIEQKEIWQSVLLEMLKVCKHIKVDSVSESSLKKRYKSILEVYYEMYLNELNHLVKRGLIKKYRRIESNQLALKGKLVFAKNINKNTVHKERMYCEHQVYDKDHLLNQILLKGLNILNELTNNHLSDRVNSLLFEFEHIKQVEITKDHFKKLQLNRKSVDYSRAINIAKMLILNYSPNISSGNENMLTLLFDMNRLWEEYIFRILNKYKKEGYEVSFQNSNVFWEHKTIRPDIVVTNINKSNEAFIIDTKWKIIESNNPSDDDLKQMFAYNLHWGSTKSLLLYPQINQLDSDFGNYKYLNHGQETNQCKLGFVNILENGKIKKGEVLSKEIFNKIK